MKLTKINKVKAIIEQYQKEEPFPTFTGLLNKLQMTYREYNTIQQMFPDNVHIKTMELFKQHLEEQMEKNLIYQKDLSGYNYNALQFIMKKLNNSRYGDKVITEIKQTATNNKTQKPTLLFDNESGIDITTVQANVKSS